ncbi:hypothetical protein [Microvirga brassicacearum]|uniref:Uncharacterized protein n=1 Tax=Microvirga brassicacearum TaxID=2580413 RepID=A0A5N3PH08_9HYPH|nr:hypothetical protein [Microvirga brassicacearum]KAB0269024.1 hypothetical protein FEZ63_02645 [Microvirga brassicacearum]
MAVRLVTFSSVDAPESERWIGFFYQHDVKGPGEKRLPLVVAGVDEVTVTERAWTWWADEQTRLGLIKLRRQDRRTKAKEVREATAT